MTERIERVDEALRWEGKIPLHYEYTAGVAGEKALRALIEGKILAGHCANCGETTLPARIYCVSCYSPVKKYVRVGPKGRVRAATSKTSETGETIMFGYVVFDGVKGGIVHRVLGKAKVGDPVVARFKPRKDRAGAISDILGFEKPARS